MKLKKILLQPSVTEVFLPKGSKILKIITTQTEAFLYVLLSNEKWELKENSTSLKIEEYYFRIFYDNQTIPEQAVYVDSFSLDNGYTFRHLFEIRKEDI